MIEPLKLVVCPLQFCGWRWYGPDLDLLHEKEDEHWLEYHADQADTSTLASGDAPNADA